MRSYSKVSRLQLVRLDAGVPLEDALAVYRKDPNVLYAEPDYLLKADSIPTDIRFPELWGLHNTGQTGGKPGADIHALEAWTHSTGSREVVVGIADTGLDYTHEDLVDNVFRNNSDCNQNGLDDDGDGYVDDCYGIDVVNGDSDPMDDHGHGTHVAGTIGATGNNGLGVVGVNWQVRLLPCKFLDAGGFGSTSGAIACLEYFATLKEQGINIVATNNSWGGGSYSQALADAIDLLRQNGILFIAAAGNSGLDTVLFGNFPSDYYLPNVIAVAATDASDALAPFSNFGRRSVHLGAPGVGILSTLPQGAYGTRSGTSMAAPHVTGAAALLKAQDPTRDWKTIRNLILAGGDVTPSLTNTITQRRLNVDGAMTCKDSVLRTVLQPRSETVTTYANAPVNFAVLHINCGIPNGNIAAVVDGGIEALTLLDDGLGADREAGDGIYSVQWLPTSGGTHTVTFGGDETVVVQVLSTYRYSTADYHYRAISGTSLKLDDDDFALLSTPFPVLFGGGAFDKLYVNSNGNITFTAPYTNPFSESIPTLTASTLVAPFWDDLSPLVGYVSNGGSKNNVFWEVIGAAPNRELVVEWRDVPPHGSCFECYGDYPPIVSFQVVFFEGSSNILFNYADVIFDPTIPSQFVSHNNGGRATVGIQVAPGIGTLFSYHTPTVQNNSAILWELGNASPTLKQLAPFSALTGSTGLTLKLTGWNFVADSVATWNGMSHPAKMVNSGELDVPLTTGDLAADGHYPVAVQNPSPGGGTSESIPFDVYSNNPVPVLASSYSGDRYLKAEREIPATLYVTGSNFVNGSVLRWNGSDRTTKNVSSTFLTATIPITDFATAGAFEVTVFNPAPGGGSSNAVTATVENPPPDIGGLSPGWARVSQPIGFLRLVSSGNESFVHTSVVRWNGIDLPTTFVDNDNLNASVPEDYVSQPGVVEISVFNPSPGGGVATTGFAILAPPPNDDRSAAIDTTPLPFTDTADTRGATTGANDPTPGCGASVGLGNSSIWYKLTAPRDMTVLAQANMNYPLGLRLVLSAWLLDTPLGCSSEWDSQSNGAPLIMDVKAGVTYFFMVTDDFGTGDAEVTFSLQEATPMMWLSRTNINFGPLWLRSTSSQQALTVLNAGTTYLEIQDVFSTLPGLLIDWHLCNSMSPGYGCDIYLRYRPETVGPVSGTLTIVSNAPGDPSTVNISAIGIDQTLTPARPGRPARPGNGSLYPALKFRPLQQEQQ